MVIACQVTRGLDISASAFVHQRWWKHATGQRVILISADLDELMTLSDRLAVIYAGKIEAVRPVNQYTKEELSMFMTEQVKIGRVMGSLLRKIKRSA